MKAVASVEQVTVGISSTPGMSFESWVWHSRACLLFLLKIVMTTTCLCGSLTNICLSHAPILYPTYMLIAGLGLARPSQARDFEPCPSPSITI